MLSKKQLHVKINNMPYAFNTFSRTWRKVPEILNLLHFTYLDCVYDLQYSMKKNFILSEEMFTCCGCECFFEFQDSNIQLYYLEQNLATITSDLYLKIILHENIKTPDYRLCCTHKFNNNVFY